MIDHVDRRQVLLGTMAAGCALGAGNPARAQSGLDGATHYPLPDATTGSQVSFDAGWRFWRGVLSGAEEPGFDDRSWRPLDLPHDWSIEDLPNAAKPDGGKATATNSTWSELAEVPPRSGPFDSEAAGGRSTGFQVGGEGWYRKSFLLDPPAEGARVALRFDGVFQNADVWLNGMPLAFHPYGYTPFMVDLTPHLRRGRANVLALRVRNVGKTSRWASGSGITRHVWLVAKPALSITDSGVAITTPEVGPDRARVRVEVELDNHAAAANAEIRVTLRAPGGARLDSRQQAVRLSPGETGAVTAEFVVPSPALWSLESPALHVAEVELLAGGVPVDRRVVDFGIRSIEVSGAAGFRLNGRSVKLRGVNLHQDLGALGGVSIASAELRRVRILKAAGFNAIRTSHQPPSTSFLDACDRVGMIVIDELFDMWDGEKSADDYHTYFTEWWDRDVTAIVRRDRNHPCIVFWSLGNEVAHPAGAAVPGFTPRFNGLPSWGRAMATRIRALDPHRFIIQGGALGIATLFNLAGDSPQWDYFDLGDGHYQKDYGKWHLAHPDKAMIQTESWAAAIHADWKRVADNPYMVGDFIWTGWDYLGEVGVGAPTLFDVGSPARTEDGPPSTKGYPWVAAYCGDFDLIGQPKPQYFYRRVVWGDSPLEMAVERPAPAGKEQRRFMWSFYDELPSWTWDVPEGTAMKVRVYANGDEVRLLQDGRPPQTRKLTPSDELIATFSVPYAPGRLTAIVLSGGREVARRTLQTVGKPAALRLGAEAAQGPAEPGRLNHVLIEVVDAAGRAVPDAVVPVSLELGGQVELAGVANGNPRNATSFRQPAVHTFKGKALVILKSGGAQGTGLLLASAPGLKPARLRV